MSPQAPPPSDAAGDAQQPAAREALIAEVLTSVVWLGRRLRSAGGTPFGGVRLSESQLEAMFLVAHSAAAVTPGGVARELGLTTGGVTQLLDGLSSVGLIRREPHPHDARSTVLTLTAESAAVLEDYESSVALALAPLFDDHDQNELELLTALLARTTAGT